MLYNLGRIVTYAAMGAIAGVVGQGIALAGAQQVVSIVAGVLLIGAYALPSLAGKYLRTLSFLDTIASSVQQMFGTLLQRRSFSTMFFICGGLRNCGFLMLMTAPVRAIASTRSVWRARKAGIWMMSHTAATGAACSSVSPA